MFIRVTSSSKQELKINTSQVCYILDSKVSFSNGENIDLDAGSIKNLEDNLFGDIAPANPKATEHTANLLNELHQLLGGRGEAKPTTDRKARLKSRLKDFSEEELKIAAKNCGLDEFMSGANDNNKRYATLDYLLRTSANVNKWLEAEPQKKKGMF